MVDADQVQRLGAAAELRLDQPADQIPRLPLIGRDALRGFGEFGPVGRRCDMADRLDVEKAGSWIDAAHGVDAGQDRAHEPPLHLVAARLCALDRLPDKIAAIRMDLGSLRDCPGQKADLVDEVVDRRIVCSTAPACGPLPSHRPRSGRSSRRRAGSDRSARRNASRSRSPAGHGSRRTARCALPGQGPTGPARVRPGANRCSRARSPGRALPHSRSPHRAGAGGRCSRPCRAAGRRR
jgi:hypothetical protein